MKTAVVVGASKGLGVALVQRLLDDGYRVIAACRTQGAQQPVAKIKDQNLLIVPIDVADDESIISAAKSISDTTQKIDLLINNAGVNKDTVGGAKEKSTQLGSLDRGVIAKMIQINALGPIMVTQALLPLLSGAKVVNISSNRASFTDRDAEDNYNNYGYATSKIALNMLTRDLAHDLKRVSTGVYLIHPGWVLTDMSPDGAELKPEEAADKIVSTIEKLTQKQSGGFFDNEGKEFPR